MSYNKNEQLDSAINLVSLILGILNLQENLTQNDKQDIMDNLNKKSDELLNQIHSHLKKQDEKIDLILELLTNQNY